MAKNVNRDYMSGMPSSMYFEKAKGIIAKIQFSLSGENGGEWGVEINDGNIFKAGIRHWFIGTNNRYIVPVGKHFYIITEIGK